MTAIAPGTQKKLNRKTFLHQGIFVFQGQQVIVKEQQGSGYVVEFLDREGFPHLLEGVQADELID